MSVSNWNLFANAASAACIAGAGGLGVVLTDKSHQERILSTIAASVTGAALAVLAHLFGSGILVGAGMFVGYSILCSKHTPKIEQLIGEAFLGAFIGFLLQAASKL